jgi:hypothetical protein
MPVLAKPQVRYGYYPRVKFCAHARTRRVKYPRISVPVDKIAIPIHANQPAIATPTPTRGANSVPITAKQNYAYERVNHVAVEEAQEAPDVVIGMFLINDTSAVVLFDSGASHSFISATYVRKYNLPLALLRCQMIVSFPGGDTPARQLCLKVNLKIRGGRLCRQPHCLGIEGHRCHSWHGLVE